MQTMQQYNSYAMTLRNLSWKVYRPEAFCHAETSPDCPGGEGPFVQRPVTHV